MQSLVAISAIAYQVFMLFRSFGILFVELFAICPCPSFGRP